MNAPVLSQERKPRFLVAVDFTHYSLAVIAEAVAEAIVSSASVTLLAVVETNCPAPPTGPVNENRLFTGLIHEATTKLAGLEQIFRPFIEIDSVVKIGRPYQVITQFALVGGYRVIFMTKHFHGWFHRLCSKHTVERVVEIAPCPVRVLSPMTLERKRSQRARLAPRALVLTET